MKNRYDVIVVGAGPAGSWAARYAALGGASVLLLEKDREVGLPVRCAEGVPIDQIRALVDLDESWIAQEITRGIIVAPDGREVEGWSGEKGYILHRKLFDAGLAQRASEAGAEVVTKAYVYGLIQENGKTAGVRVRHLGEEIEIHAGIVIGADGIESRVGRWAGLDSHTPVTEMESCAQMVLGNLDIDHEAVKLWVGREVAPGGYLWLFPKGPGWANVGLGIMGKYSAKKKAIQYLKEFVDQNFPNASILSIVAGGVPTSPQLKSIIADGLMLVGDAGHQVDPLSGGGIINALIGGKLAGETAAEAIKAGNVSAKFLKRYQSAWDKVRKKDLQLAYKIKKIVYHFEDDDLNQIADVVLALPLEKRTNFGIFKAALKKHPGLILDMAKLWIK